MKIKLTLLDGDKNYLDRITASLTARFPDKLEIYSFTDASAALDGLESARIDVFIADSAFDIDCKRLPRNCGFAYFVESPTVETYGDRPAICKYQKIDAIYRAALDIYSENVSEAIGIRADDGSNVRVVAFASPAGGVGSSSSAAACAVSFALGGKRTLYLNLETFGGAVPFFSGEGQTDFGDVIFALKSRKSGLRLKLESGAKRDASGVFFYSPPETALDMAELNAEETRRLITELKLSGIYDGIIIDVDFSLGGNAMEVFRLATEIVLVSDGSEISNMKLTRAYRALGLIEQSSDTALLPRVALFYNKFSNKTGRMTEDGIKTLGGAPKYERAAPEQVVEQLVGLGVFRKFAAAEA
jgi:MinD-like ATPase involved in chromosome partitioning or flagellar assembly